MTGRVLADWVTELCAADHTPTAAEVFRHAAASLAPTLEGLPPALEGAISEGCRAMILDESLLDSPPSPQDWLFAHQEQLDTAPVPAPTVVVHRHADGSITVSVVDDDTLSDETSDPRSLVDGDRAAALVTQVGLVWRVVTAGLALAAVSDEIGQEIDRNAASTLTPRSGHRRAYEALAATERFFGYTAAFATFLAACESVGTGRGGAVAVASTELLVAALADGRRTGHGPALDPAWAQAEIALACR